MNTSPRFVPEQNDGSCDSFPWLKSRVMRRWKLPYLCMNKNFHHNLYAQTQSSANTNRKTLAITSRRHYIGWLHKTSFLSAPLQFSFVTCFFLGGSSFCISGIDMSNNYLFNIILTLFVFARDLLNTVILKALLDSVKRTHNQSSASWSMLFSWQSLVIIW